MRPLIVLVIKRYMRKDYEKLLTHFQSAEPPDDLFDKIMSRINLERRLLVIKRRFVIFSIGLVGSIVAFIPVFRMVQTGFNESGFVEFFSLIFSDSGVVISYWQNFTLTLLESLPVMSIAVFLATVFVFLGSLKFLVQDIKIIFNPAQTVNN